MWRSVITGTGSYIPDLIKKNADFATSQFYSEAQIRIDNPSSEITEKFRKITGIEQRRYAPPGICASDMALEAARIAISDSGIDPESIDQIILAHNFGDVRAASQQADGVPALAARVKRGLAIRNPSCVAYDLVFGCPGWLQGLIQADCFFKAGVAKTALIIGSETLSRIIDIFDRDSMIFSDGAGACILQYCDVEPQGPGILSYSARSDSLGETSYIRFDKSNNPAINQDKRFIKMRGRKVFEYALRHVPCSMQACLNASGQPISQLKKVFIHQANEKMDESMVRAFFDLYGWTSIPKKMLPMCIHWLGNSSVATIPTLFDLVRKGKLEDHELNVGELIMFASVGAGMNVNAICYRY